MAFRRGSGREALLDWCEEHGLTVEAAVEKILTALGDPLPPKQTGAERVSAANVS